jgi:hypothetical protein
MASTSQNSRADRADQITRQNNQGEPLPPPAFAVQSPFDEVLLQDVAASLPAPLAARMGAARSLDEVHDWIAAGAIYRGIGADAYLSQTFLDEVEKNPQQTGLALAKAFAARMEPPPRDANWHRHDQLGLVLQLTVVGLVLTCRSLLFNWLGSSSSYEGGVLQGLVGLPLIINTVPNTFLGAATLFCAAAWLACEAICMPSLMERARQLPARHHELPPPLAWRTDALYGFWFTQSICLMGVICFCYWKHVVKMLASSETFVWQEAIGIVLLFLVWYVVASARSMLKLGTNLV